MAHRRWVWVLCALATIMWTPTGSAADQDLPIFDTHVHYSQDAWSQYDPASVLRTFDAANVPRALVSSSPDDGTVRLYGTDKRRVAPSLRPYRDAVGQGNWSSDQRTVAYLRDRLKSGFYLGIGEFHLHDPAAVSGPTVAGTARLATARDILLHVHSGAAVIRALFAAHPKAKILWAHAGMSEPPAVVSAMLDRYPNLWAELSFRESDIAPAGTLTAPWRALFTRHRDRFTIGSDTYVTSRWGQYTDLINIHRRWLRQLPPDIAKAIAYRNAVRLFGSGGIRALEK